MKIASRLPPIESCSRALAAASVLLYYLLLLAASRQSSCSLTSGGGGGGDGDDAGGSGGGNAKSTTQNVEADYLLSSLPLPPPPPPSPLQSSPNWPRAPRGPSSGPVQQIASKQDKRDERKLSIRSLKHKDVSSQAAPSNKLPAGAVKFGTQLEPNGAANSSSCLRADAGGGQPGAAGLELAVGAGPDLLSGGGSSTAALALQHQRSSFGYTQARASEFVKPNFYTLRLKLDPEKRKFGGQLMVSVDLLSWEQASQSSSSGSGSSSSAPPELRFSETQVRPEVASADAGGTAPATTTATTTAPIAATTVSQSEAASQEQAGGQSDAYANQTTAGETAVRYLSLHAGANLSIKKAFYVFTSRSSIQIPATRIGRNLTSELLTLDFHPNAIPLPSAGFLLLVYSGQVNETESHGLFVHKSAPASRPQNSGGPGGGGGGGGEGDFVAGLATHMEPSFARRLFPAWDEPHLKARFSLIVVLPFRGYETLSNMPVKRKSISLSCSGEPLQEVEFHTTPAMSTYLLALVVGKFEFIESITPNNCRVRAYFYSNETQTSAAAAAGQPKWQQQQQQQQQQGRVTLRNDASENQTEPQVPAANVNLRRRAAQMALDFAVRTFDYLESALGVKYPLAKFDMIALRDFNSGGMENWGASLFHENYLLCDNHNQNVNIRVNGGSNRPKRLVVPLVVAHEIVHQWFGNLLTARDWAHLWLNEGFAQLLMYEVAQTLMPAEPYWHIFVEDNRRSAMAEDELVTSSRALELVHASPLDEEDQLSLFDQLTYNKGAMVVRMVQFALGPADFLAGLRHYLLKHSYGSVSSHDLWAALEESATTEGAGAGAQDRQLEASMAAWLRLEGFPLLRVRVSELPDGAHYKLDYAQERFTLLPAEGAGLQQQSQPQSQQRDNDSSKSATASHWAGWLWSIPVTIASERTPEPDENELRLWPAQRNGSALLLTARAGSVLLPRAALGAWFKLNHKAIGYFRVDYELELAGALPGTVNMLARMAPAVRDQTMTTIDRYTLLEDLFAMVLSGRKPLVGYLSLVQEAYAQEHELLVLRFIFDSLERVRLALVSNSPAAGRLERQFDAYVQRYVRKLIGALEARSRKQRQQQQQQQQQQQGPMPVPVLEPEHEPESGAEQDDAPMSHHGALATSLANSARRRRSDSGAQKVAGAHDSRPPPPPPPPPPLVTRQKRPERRHSSAPGANDASANFVANAELLELLDSARLAHGSAPLARWASDLFARHFQHKGGALEQLGRELRASIYSAALNYQQQQQQQQRRQMARPATNESGDYVTSLVRSLGDIWAELRQAPAGPAHVNRTTGTGGGGGGGGGVFAKLLGAYELGETSSSERAAIAQALGATRDLGEQTLLLNVTLASLPGPMFRAHDAGLLLDSLARSRDGRKLVWGALSEQSKLLKQRQLLAPALKSVSRGLIEEPAGPGAASVEGQLRQLYVIYGASELGKLIGQSIEWVRINSLWFKRDHDSLAEFLAAQPAH